MSERTMTIARGLTRLKTIKAQLTNITGNINQFGAWNDKKKHPLGDTTHNDLKKNHAQAREKITSLYQQFHDLKKEYIKIKTAIDVANMSTKIEVAGQTMTLHEAMLHEREIAGFVANLVKAYNQSVLIATNDVNRHNSQYANVNEDAKAALLADVSYLVGKSDVAVLDQFTIEFLTEIDGIKNEINALTPINID